MSRGAKLGLFALFVLIGPGLAAFTGVYSFVQAEKLSFCASCHVMTPWVADLENPNSKSLAALHFRNRYIPNDQCYTCHVDYAFLGPVDAKLNGVHHVEVYYFGQATPRAIRLYKPFPNANCLRCHAGSEPFLKNPTHRAVMGLIVANRVRCMNCHQPIHTPQFKPFAQPADAGPGAPTAAGGTP